MRMSRPLSLCIHILMVSTFTYSVPLYSSTYFVNRGCGHRPMDDDLMGRIVGGHNASFGQVPWQAVIAETKLFGWLSTVRKCGGVILSSRHILTAAHCASSWIFSSVRVVVGEQVYSFKSDHEVDQMRYDADRVQSLEVQDIVVHPDFDRMNLDNDVAIVTLKSDLKFGYNVQPICLPDQDEDVTNRVALVSGWGYTRYRRGPLPNTLQVVHLPILSNEKCTEMYAVAGFKKNLPETSMCAGFSEGGGDSCEGDSGGPLTIYSHRLERWVVAGIVSNGIKCGEPNLPGVYARISEFVPWILSQMRRHEGEGAGGGYV